MFNSFFNWLTELLHNFGNTVVQLLPHSPFRNFIDSIQLNQTYLGWLNWFIPVQLFLNIVVLWLAAIAGFYILSVILRWLKIIGD